MMAILHRPLHLLRSRINMPLIMNGFCTIPPPKKMSKIVWIDMEMTGLDSKNDKILEVACIVTDKDLNVIAEGPNLVVHQPDHVLSSMNEWCVEQHGKTGLTELSRQSKLSITDAEKQLLTFVSKYTKQNECPLAGNSVYVDRMFMAELMPQLERFLHYRIIDVSTVKELCKRWNPTVFSKTPAKKLCHRALDDIKESIEELKYYQKNFCFTDL